jgi:hypothetical protein
MGHEETRTLDERIAAFMGDLPEAMDCHGGYDDTKLTKLVRDEIALAVKTGLLPVGTKVSVRKNHYRSFTVDIVEWKEGAVFCDDYTAHLLDPTGTDWDRDARHQDLVRDAGNWRHAGRPEYTPALRGAVRICERIADRHNYNNSDPQTDYFDVGYYLDVEARTVEANARTGIAMESDPAYRALLADAMIAAKALGSACVKSVCGRRGINGCGKWSLEALIKVAARANGRPVAYDKRRRAWLPIGVTLQEAAV